MTGREGPQRDRGASRADRSALVPVGPAEERTPPAPVGPAEERTPPAPVGPAGQRTPPALDCRGRRCPLPIVELARHIGDVAVGDTVELAADDPAARLDVPAWCRMRGHDYLGESAAADGVPVYTVRRAR